jgi:hypothetical protein
MSVYLSNRIDEIANATSVFVVGASGYPSMRATTRQARLGHSRFDSATTSTITLRGRATF